MFYKVKEVPGGFLVFADVAGTEYPIATFHKVSWSSSGISSAESRARGYAENANKWLENWEKKGKGVLITDNDFR